MKEEGKEPAQSAVTVEPKPEANVEMKDEEVKSFLIVILHFVLETMFSMITTN